MIYHGKRTVYYLNLTNLKLTIIQMLFFIIMDGYTTPSLVLRVGASLLSLCMAAPNGQLNSPMLQKDGLQLLA